MSWKDVIEKATESQIKYAESLLEELYGDINEPIYKMSKGELCSLISKLKTIKDEG